jgi:hypothetical protein
MYKIFGIPSGRCIKSIHRKPSFAIRHTQKYSAHNTNINRVEKEKEKRNKKLHNLDKMIVHDIFETPSFYINDNRLPIHYERMKWRDDTNRRRVLGEQQCRERRLREECERRKLEGDSDRKKYQEKKKLMKDQQLCHKLDLEEPSNQNNNDNQGMVEDGGSQWVFKLVRGSDGRLYKVPVRVALSGNYRSCNNSIELPRLSSQSGNCVDESIQMNDVNHQLDYNTNVNSVRNESKNELDAEQSDKHIYAKPACTVDEGNYNMIVVQQKNKPENQESQSNDCRKTRDKSSFNRKNFAILDENADYIVVEDASDSDLDDDDLKSIWRNRLPSPGQWMEPISTPFQL